MGVLQGDDEKETTRSYRIREKLLLEDAEFFIVLCQGHCIIETLFSDCFWAILYF